MFTYETEIKWHQTDAAGVLFYAQVFLIIHDAYQALMQAIGFPLSHFTYDLKYAIPIVHAEANYHTPLRCGDQVKINARVDHIGKSSFSVSYSLSDKKGIKAATAQTIHVAIDPKHHKKINLPEPLSSALAVYK